MSLPAISLLIAISAIGVIGFLVWPNGGIIAQWRRFRMGVTKSLIEDALKHVYDGEYSGIPSTIHSVSGALGISSDHASEIAKKLESMALVSTMESGVLKLSPEGRSYALRVIRIHRLWERYLADETGMPETDWHRQAEAKEHRLSTAEANALAARMGNPQVDPHGDPIPTSSGEIRVLDGVSLTSLAAGEGGEIIHIEDEPNALYAQLVAERLHVGQRIKVLSIESDRVHFEADGEESVLAPILAAQIMVRRLMLLPDEIHESYRTLDTLNMGESAIVAGISKACRGLMRRRLMDLGLVPGSPIAAELRGASGDPVAYRVRGALIALRQSQGRLIFLKPEKEKNNHERNN